MGPELWKTSNSAYGAHAWVSPLLHTGARCKVAPLKQASSIPQQMQRVFPRQALRESKSSPELRAPGSTGAGRVISHPYVAPLKATLATFQGTAPDGLDYFVERFMERPDKQLLVQQKTPSVVSMEHQAPQSQAKARDVYKSTLSAGYGKPANKVAVSNLQQRFPQASLQQVEAALRAEDGHAGRAAKLLKEWAEVKARKLVKRDMSIEREKKIDWAKAEPSKWKFRTKEFDGKYTLSSFDPPSVVLTQGPLLQGLKNMKTNPSSYLGVFYESDVAASPATSQEYSLVHRSKGNMTVEETEDGGFTWMEAMYNVLPKAKIQADEFTDAMTLEGSRLGRPWCPGRGDGCADVPGITIIGDVDPFDVMQGGVGDCWLLCALSALAEFPGAIRKLFKKTVDIDEMPKKSFNTYTISLFDLSTWEPVDIIIDERLCTKPNGQELLGCSPSSTGDLWACYLEKAIAIHCGGWDNICGGQCTHAWRMLTGCKDQYVFEQVADGRWTCGGDFNPNKQQWEQTANSRDDGFVGCWPMTWPVVGGGGKRGSKMTSMQLFDRMCAWDDANYIMAAGSTGKSDKDKTDGIVDNHTYTVLTCARDVAGSGFDLIKVRNPWGSGEFENGKWDDHGVHWERYPRVKKALNPTLGVDDGTFWMERDEFFKYFKTVYLCALDMSDFIEYEEIKD
eukprot:TRINITY_DN95325_c0_g1_i1.p1 TRINITY_DN95325_c0_g1~~TRINITY_DN95325_c0_g1_i1.p1  ORF type:complete len:686 (-),score=154.25 TRINITY_DN95325_c0_g1_i1:33-2066(-)